MIAGLLLQAISLGAFVLFFADFSWRCHKGKVDMDSDKHHIRQSTFFKLFRVSLFLAAIFILIRSIFRVAELWGGFDGSLWNDETDFLVLDGAMMAAAVLCLTAFHPGPAFRDQWAAADWTFRKQKYGAVGKRERGADNSYASLQSHH